MAIYICSKCRFCFERKGDVEQCVDCGNMNVRVATDDEALEYRRNRADADQNWPTGESADNTPPLAKTARLQPPETVLQ